MTAPPGGVISTAGNSSVTGTSVPTLPDGTPNFGMLPGSGSTPVDRSGMLNIWDIPSEIDGQQIWFDVGQKKSKATVEEPHNSAYDSQVPAAARKAASTSFVDISHNEILKSPAEIMKQFYAMSFNDPNSFFALQKMLASGPWGTINATGSMDHDTEVALGNAMLQYVKLTKGAGVGVSFVDYLMQTGQRAQQLGGDGTSLGSGGSGTKAPFQASLTDPAQIRAAAQQAFQSAIGKGATSSQLDAFVAQFQAAQTGAEQANYNGKGTVTGPDLAAQAGQYAQSADPQAYQQNKRQAYVDALVNMFAPSGSQRPNMTPVPTA